jgi:imidazolonepropionase-like amidohydrolase
MSLLAQASPHQAPGLPDPYPSTYKRLPSKDTLIVDATIFDGIGHKLIHAGILIRSGKMVAVGPDLNGPLGTKIINAQGAYLTPGLVDVHSHLGDFTTPYTLQDAKVSDVNEDSSPNSAQVWVLHSIRVQDPQFARVRAAGVTTLQVLPGSNDLFGGRGVVLNVAGYRQAWADATDYKRRWDNYNAKHNRGLPPPARDLKLETLAGVLRGQILVDMHCYRADEMAIMMDVAKEFDYKINAFHHGVEAYKIVPLLKENHVCVVVWADWWGFKVEAFDGIRSNAAFVDTGGGCVMLHSDAPISAEHLPLDAALILGDAHRAGVDIPEERAIEWLTINPAKSLHLDDQIGSLEPGKNADVVLCSGDPFSVYTWAEMVFLDGAVVYDRNDPARQAKSDFEIGQRAIASPR